MKITLNNWHDEYILCEACNFKKLNKIEDSFYELKISNEKCQEPCRFICRWMTVKHNFLFQELHALQEYLTSCKNYFKTNITVILESKPFAKPLNGQVYKKVLEQIGEKEKN